MSTSHRTSLPAQQRLPPTCPLQLLSPAEPQALGHLWSRQGPTADRGAGCCMDPLSVPGGDTGNTGAAPLVLGTPMPRPKASPLKPPLAHSRVPPPCANPARVTAPGSTTLILSHGILAALPSWHWFMGLGQATGWVPLASPTLGCVPALVLLPWVSLAWAQFGVSTGTRGLRPCGGRGASPRSHRRAAEVAQLRDPCEQGCCDSTPAQPSRAPRTTS